MVFQDPYSSLNPRMTVGEMLRELLRVHQIVPRTEVDQRCRGAARPGRAAPTTRWTRYPRQFSGGQRQRVAIARALALRARASWSPTSRCRRWTSACRPRSSTCSRDLRRELGLTLLFISHNLAVVRHLCDRVAVMYLGRIVEVAPTEELFANPRHPYTQGLLEAIPRLSPGARRRRRPWPATRRAR